MENYVFNFNDQEALAHQDDGLCQRLYEHMWAELGKQDILAQNALPTLQSTYKIHWVARYASVILYPPLDSMNLISDVYLIGLDGWKAKVHSSIHGREYAAYPNVTQPQVFTLGLIPSKDIEEALSNFDVNLTKSECNAGSDRRQSAGYQGNQKTPSFARLILMQTLGGFQNIPNAGGTTDVGLHTNCRPRNTSCPLVLSTLHTILRFHGEASDETFCKCVVCYYLVFLEALSSAIEVYDCRKVDRVFTVIREIEGWLNKVDDQEFKELC
jgi:hypothetical protein